MEILTAAGMWLAGHIQEVIWTLLVWNLLVFALYGMDKRRAVRGNWRIQEKTLLLVAFLYGGLGALAGMRVFHHKTRHRKFTVLVPLAFLLQLALPGVLSFIIYRQ
jgi:uncharacterized membrane protein YsdA (DUF1294 family)